MTHLLNASNITPGVDSTSFYEAWSAPAFATKNSASESGAEQSSTVTRNFFQPTEMSTELTSFSRGESEGKDEGGICRLGQICSMMSPAYTP